MTPPKFHPDNRGTARKPNYRVVYYVKGKRYREATGARTIAEYNAYVAQLSRRFTLGTWAPPRERDSDGLTFAAWAPQAIAKRVALGVKTAESDEESIVRNHLLPEFGDECLVDLVPFQRVEQGFANIRTKVRAGSTVRNIHVVWHAIMRLAAKAGHIAQPPAPLTVKDGELPPVVSTRPEGWRADAKFTREEIAALLNCEAVELQSRVMYIAYFLTASRFAEVVTLRWRDWNRDIGPLTMLTLKAVKTRRHRGQLYRRVPVPTVLAAWLSWWHREGFELVTMRKPQPDDLIFPTQSAARRRRGELECAYNEVYGRWSRRHLPAAGLRHRRLHDSRGSYISIVRSSGAQKDIVRAITHRAVDDKVLDEGYTVWEWQAVCAAVSGVDWRLPGPPDSKAVVVPIRSRKARQ